MRISKGVRNVSRDNLAIGVKCKLPCQSSETTAPQFLTSISLAFHALARSLTQRTTKPTTK